MLPLEPRLMAELSTEVSDFRNNSIVYFSDAITDENEEISPSNLKDKDVSVSEIKSDPEGGVSKKRVRFLPEGCLVNVREIPARSESPSNRSESSSGDSDSESDDFSYESDSDNENDDDGCLRAPSSPLTDTTILRSATVISETSKFTVSRKVGKPVSRHSETAVIRSEHLTTQTSSSPAQIRTKHKSKPRIRTRQASKPVETELNDNKPIANVKRRKPAKKTTLSLEKQLNQRQSFAKLASRQQSAKNVNRRASHKTANGADIMFAQRRISSARSDSRSTSKNGNLAAVSRTLLPVLHTAVDAHRDTQDGHIITTLQLLSVGNVQSVNGFTFPAHQTSIVHFPQILLNNDKQQSIILPALNKGDINRQASKEYHFQQTYDDTNNTQVTLRPSSSNKRSYAWQMANGNVPVSLQSTPSIAQLWDNEHEVSGRLFTNAYQSASVARVISSNIVRKL
ncbi:unnamed protein product [Candidula unifasciata]|uniref:Uncharacterized protein n=1 Tax=Candidula unifasciata TaxID=100452 RepID=A0A8S3ZLH8_9EUPU|nr:unnamed protein product [Candidula unifasciata]